MGRRGAEDQSRAFPAAPLIELDRGGDIECGSARSEAWTDSCERAFDRFRDQFQELTRGVVRVALEQRGSHRRRGASAEAESDIGPGRMSHETEVTRHQAAAGIDVSISQRVQSTPRKAVTGRASRNQQC